MDLDCMDFELSATSNYQRIDFTQVGASFLSCVITPKLLAQKLQKILPPSISGSSPAFQSGDVTIGSVNYTATGFRNTVSSGGLGIFNIQLLFRISISISAFGLSKEYIFDVITPFTLMAKTCAPVGIYIDYQAVQSNTISINCLSSINNPIDQKICPTVEAQLRQMLPIQINKKLAESESQRYFDLTQMDAAKVAVVDVDLDMSINRISNISLEQFGINFMDRVVSANRLTQNISEAILTSQNGSNHIQGQKEVPHAHVTYSGELSCSQVSLVGRASNNLRFSFYVNVQLDIRVGLALGVESWILNIQAPVIIDAQAFVYSGTELRLYFPFSQVDSNNINMQSKQTSATGMAWVGGLEDQVKIAVAEALNQAFLTVNQKGKNIVNITTIAAKL